jgi:hypothetical protein
VQVGVPLLASDSGAFYLFFLFRPGSHLEMSSQLSRRECSELGSKPAVALRLTAQLAARLEFKPRIHFFFSFQFHSSPICIIP